MTLSIKCCRECPRRYVGCHANCEDYISERKLLDDYNASVKRQKEIESLFIIDRLKKKNDSF